MLSEFEDHSETEDARVLKMGADHQRGVAGDTYMGTLADGGYSATGFDCRGRYVRKGMVELRSRPRPPSRGSPRGLGMSLNQVAERRAEWDSALSSGASLKALSARWEREAEQVRAVAKVAYYLRYRRECESAADFRRFHRLVFGTLPDREAVRDWARERADAKFGGVPSDHE